MNNCNEEKKILSVIFKNINKNNSQKVKKWEKENKKAVDLYNQRVKKNSLFSDGLRQF